MPRTNDTIAARLAGNVMAVDAALGRRDLAAAWPEAGAPAVAGATALLGGELRFERGQRHAVVRGIGFLPVRGVLTPNSEALERYFGWSTYAGLQAAAAELAANDEVRAVVAIFDSPGGMVLGLEGAAAALSGLAASKPLHALVDPLAASAAYWLAVTAQEITVTPGGVVGSIGAALTAGAYVQPGAFDGVQWFDHLSSHARAKWPDPTTEAGKTEINRVLDEAEARFHGAVAAARGIPLDELPARLSVTDDPLDGGATFADTDAVARGLADHVETATAFLARIFEAHAPRPAASGRRAMSRRGALAEAAAAQARATF